MPRQSCLCCTARLVLAAQPKRVAAPFESYSRGAFLCRNHRVRSFRGLPQGPTHAHAVRSALIRLARAR